MKPSNRPWSVGKVLIDLTPLLDVVFILLIVVLSYQDTYSANADQKYTEAEQIVSRVEDEKSKLESETETIKEQLSTYTEIDDYVNVVTVYADYQPSNRKYRTIYLSINDGDIMEFSLNPSNGETAWGECESVIKECIEASDSTPVICSIKNEKMLYRDEQKIYQLFENLSAEFNNVYLKNYTETNNE